MFPNTRALIVDHRPFAEQNLRKQLQMLEVQVESESNGSRGADRALNEPFDVIFLAPELPVLDAEQVESLLRDSRVGSKVVRLSIAPVENCPAWGTVSVIREPVQFGVLDHLLHRLLPSQKATSIVPVIDQSIVAMQEAIASRDYDQAISLAQRIRELVGPIEDQELSAAVDLVESCFEGENLEAARWDEVRSRISELSQLVGSGQLRQATSH